MPITPYQWPSTRGRSAALAGPQWQRCAPISRPRRRTAGPHVSYAAVTARTGARAVDGTLVMPRVGIAVRSRTMALIRRFVHRPGSAAGYRSEVECGYRVVTEHDKTLLHLETYGSS